MFTFVPGKYFLRRVIIFTNGKKYRYKSGYFEFAKNVYGEHARLKNVNFDLKDKEHLG